MNALVKYLQEQSLLLRVPADLNQQFESWVDGLVELDVDIEIFDDACGVMVVNEAIFRVKLCTLPHHVETFKTFDDHLFYQSGDIHQVLVIEGGEFPSVDLYQKEMRQIVAEPEHIHYTPDKQTIDSFAHEKGFGALVVNHQLPHGLTAPLRHVVQRTINTTIDPPPEIVSEAELAFTRMEPGQTTYVTEYDLVTKEDALKLQHEVEKAYQSSVEGQRDAIAIKKALQSASNNSQAQQQQQQNQEPVADVDSLFSMLMMGGGDDDDDDDGGSGDDGEEEASTTTTATTTTTKPTATPNTNQIGGGGGGGTTGGIHSKQQGSMSSLLHQGGLSPGANLNFMDIVGGGGQDGQPLDSFLNNVGSSTGTIPTTIGGPSPAQLSNFNTHGLPGIPSLGLGSHGQLDFASLPKVPTGAGVGVVPGLGDLPNLQFLPPLPDIDLSTVTLGGGIGGGVGMGMGQGFQTIADLESAPPLPSLDVGVVGSGGETRMTDFYQGLGGQTSDLSRDMTDGTMPLDQSSLPPPPQSQQQQSQQQQPPSSSFPTAPPPTTTDPQLLGSYTDEAMRLNTGFPQPIGGATTNLVDFGSSSFDTIDLGLNTIDTSAANTSTYPGLDGGQTGGGVGGTTAGLAYNQQLEPLPMDVGIDVGMGGLPNILPPLPTTFGLPTDAMDSTITTTTSVPATTTTTTSSAPSIDPTSSTTSPQPIPQSTTTHTNTDNPEYLRLQQAVNDAAATSAAADAKIGTGVNPIQNKQFQNAAKTAKDKLAQAQAALDSYR